MDLLSDLVRLAPAHGGTFALSYLRPPWGLRLLDPAPLALHVVQRGRAHVRLDHGEAHGDEPEDGPGTGHGTASAARLLGEGDLVLVQGAHVLSDPPDAVPGAVIYGPARSATPAEHPSAASDRWRTSGARSYGEGPDAPTVIAHAAYRADSVLSRRLLSALPAVLPIAADLVPASLRELLATEVAREGVHQQAVLDRLLDLLLAVALRGWLQQAGTSAPWAAALQDPHVGRALSAIHDQPGAPWTTASLAAHAHTSRAQLARRFTALLGQPPITYLTRYRIDLAAEMITSTRRPLASIARDVGYSDAFSLSTAYRRVTGQPPQAHRRPPAQVQGPGRGTSVPS